MIFFFLLFFTKRNISKINDKLNYINIGFAPSIDYDLDKKHLVIKLGKDGKQTIRVEVKDPTKIDIKKNEKLFDSLTKH